MEAGRLDDSRRVLSDAAARFPRDADVLHACGGVLARRGELEPALAALKTASELRPRDADIATNLGAALASLGRFAEAVDQFDRALRLSPNHRAAQANVAEFGPRAVADLERRLRAAPDDADAAIKLGRLLLLRGDRARGEAVLYDLLKKHPDRTDARELLTEPATLR
jgi:Flp pilus assembly protein TadD